VECGTIYYVFKRGLKPLARYLPTKEAASRNPQLKIPEPGPLLLRSAERQFPALRLQLPLRRTW
jgi:hypothetical protein